MTLRILEDLKTLLNLSEFIETLKIAKNDLKFTKKCILESKEIKEVARRIPVK